MVELGVEVTDVDLQGQTNLFRFHRLLILAVLFLPLGLLVTVLDFFGGAVFIQTKTGDVAHRHFERGRDRR
jgi:hypothetical protein